MYSVFLTQYDGAILGPIAKVLGWILEVIFEALSFIGIENAGLCIIIFTFIINALMIPATIKQQKFTKLSSKMTPEINKIQEKYKNKKDEVSMQKQNAELQAVYTKYGASPTSGCLPMLITFPIMFALYRVIYNIPAYVGPIMELYENIAVAMQSTDYVAIMTEYANNFSALNVSKWGDISQSIPVNYLIDIMSQFQTSDWADIMTNPAFASIKDVIEMNSSHIMNINNFFLGLNIAEVPMSQITSGAVSLGTKFVYVCVPVLAVVTQMLQTKLMTTNKPSQNKEEDPTAATMKSMNTIMPLMSGGFCLMLPVGIGLYWIAGSVFRIIQQIFVNKAMDGMDVDEIIAKNLEKKGKKQDKIDSAVKQYANQRTSSISEKAASANINSSKASDSKVVKNSNYKEGSISAYANLLSKNKVEKGDK